MKNIKKVRYPNVRFEAEAGFYATPQSSNLMSKIKGTNTKAEVKLRRSLWKFQCRYRLHSKRIVGRPDIIFHRQRLIIFVDGDFWHGYNWKEKKKRIISNKAYWVAKIESNIARDKKIKQLLVDDGWQVLRFWEHEIEKDLETCVKKVLMIVRGSNIISNAV